MFGINAFSQAPFAAGPYQNVYGAGISESITTITDSEALVATFITVISEALTAADSSVASKVYIDTVNDSITSADAQIGTASFSN